MMDSLQTDYDSKQFSSFMCLLDPVRNKIQMQWHKYSKYPLCVCSSNDPYDYVNDDDAQIRYRQAQTNVYAVCAYCFRCCAYVCLGRLERWLFFVKVSPTDNYCSSGTT